MNAVQRIKLSRQLLTDLSAPHDQQRRMTEVVKKLKSIPQDCLSYEHFRKIKSIISDFESMSAAAEISRLSIAIVYLCVDMIEYDARVAELENIEY